MNQKIYELVKEVVGNIYTISNKEDLMQDVFYILIKKGLLDKELTGEIKGIIIGIIRNQKFNAFNKDIKESEFPENFDAPCIEDDEISEQEKNDAIQLHLGKLRRYIFEYYYKRGKGLMKWKVWYLKYAGWRNKDIAEKLNIGGSAITAYYKYACKNLDEIVEADYNKGLISKKFNIKIVCLDKYYNFIKDYDSVRMAAEHLGLKSSRMYRALLSNAVIESKYRFVYSDEYYSGAFVPKKKRFELFVDGESKGIFENAVAAAKYLGVKRDYINVLVRKGTSRYRVDRVY